MNIQIIRKPTALEEVRALAKDVYRDMIKGVADVRREIMALGGEWHMDGNTVLLADGSKQEDVWGFNIFVEERGNSALRFTSLINIRPAQGSRSMEIEDENVRKKIRDVAQKLIPELFV